MDKSDKDLMNEILDKHNQVFAAFRRSEDQLDTALEMNRSITKALREARRARNELISSMIQANQAALAIVNKE